MRSAPFPTGGKVRERYALNRCNSDTDSTVWMGEDVLSYFHALSVCMLRAHFYEVSFMKQKTDVKKMVIIAMLAATAFMLVALIRIPVVLFLNYEPKDVVITIGGFLLGPIASLVITLVVALVEMVTISTTGIIGCIMNFISSACFSCTAAFVYKKKRSVSGAVIGLLLGSAIMIAAMLLWNWLITPLYMANTTRADIAAMLVPVFLPFNALKAGFNSALTLMLYKPLVLALRKTGLIPSRSGNGASAKWGIYILGAALLVTCIVLLLVLRGII